MSIQFLHATPRPQMEGTDALFNEILHLQKIFGGQIKSLYPFQKPGVFYPIGFYGAHNIFSILQAEKQTQINHIFAPSLFHFPIFRFLKNPIIYNIVGSISENMSLPSHTFIQRLAKIIVSNERDLEYLKSQKIKQVQLIRTGIDQEEIRPKPLVFEHEMTLLMASAPWVSAQFFSKGVDYWLQLVKELDNLKMVFLWRDLLYVEMLKKIEEYGVAHKVEVINKKMAINDLLQKVHGVVLIANDSRLVKANPHSLIESLVGGKPVIISQQIPMSDYVKKYQCGRVLNQFKLNPLKEIVLDFQENYETFSKNAMQVQGRDFRFEGMVEAYKDLYQEGLNR